MCGSKMKTVFPMFVREENFLKNFYILEKVSNHQLTLITYVCYRKWYQTATFIK